MFRFDELVANPGGFRVLYYKYNVNTYPQYLSVEIVVSGLWKYPHPFQNTNVNTTYKRFPCVS